MVCSSHGEMIVLGLDPDKACAIGHNIKFDRCVPGTQSLGCRHTSHVSETDESEKERWVRVVVETFTAAEDVSERSDDDGVEGRRRRRNKRS